MEKNEILIYFESLKLRMLFSGYLEELKPNLLEWAKLFNGLALTRVNTKDGNYEITLQAVVNLINYINYRIFECWMCCSPGSGVYLML